MRSYSALSERISHILYAVNTIPIALFLTNGYWIEFDLMCASKESWFHEGMQWIGLQAIQTVVVRFTFKCSYSFEFISLHLCMNIEASYASKRCATMEEQRQFDAKRMTSGEQFSSLSRNTPNFQPNLEWKCAQLQHCMQLIDLFVCIHNS